MCLTIRKFACSPAFGTFASWKSHVDPREGLILRACDTGRFCLYYSQSLSLLKSFESDRAG
jgi:hypothetical protein